MAAVETRPKRAAVIFNPVKVDLKKLRREVAKAEKAAGWLTSLWLPTEADDGGTAQARQAVADRVDVVLAAGGDGTVRAVAEGLRGSGVAMALLPAGTGNVLARNLDIPVMQLAASVQTAFTGVDRAIDMGVIELERADHSRETHAFVALAGLGLDAKMIANTRPELKRRVGWLAYVDAIARSMRDSEKIRMRYRLDGGEERVMSVHTILVGNVGLLPGNVLLLPDAEVDDGLFDIVTLRPEGFGGWAQIWLKITWENGVLRRSSVGPRLAGPSREVRTLRYLRGRRLRVRLDRAEDFELDGDEFGLVLAFDAWVDPASLIIRVATL
ncbi:MAG TPA: diacylglycerol kinase family protein [Pseudolysinimonas sp.]|nr:diacylglycerol kinase family protein [Pseudolysinimonas sp.]